MPSMNASWGKALTLCISPAEDNDVDAHRCVTRNPVKQEQHVVPNASCNCRDPGQVTARLQSRRLPAPRTGTAGLSEGPIWGLDQCELQGFLVQIRGPLHVKKKINPNHNFESVLVQKPRLWCWDP